MFEDVTHNISQNLEARKLYEQVVSSHPSSAEAHLRLAEFAQEADDAQEAYRIALQAVKVAPRDAAAHLSLGHASSKLGRADEAVRALEQVAVLQPSALDVPAMIALAESYKKAGREQEAIRYYKRVLDSRPDDYECTLSLAQLHADRGPGGASQAVHYFRTALKCRPTTVDARSIYLQMATVQCAISAWKDAKATLEGAVHELPEDAEMWQKLLSICEQLKDSKGQHHCHRRLVRMLSLNRLEAIEYASLLMSEDRLREAKELLNQVIKAEPKNAAALLKLAQCLKQDGSRDGNLEEALRLFEQVLQLSPNNLEALEGAAYCNRKSNKLDQAVQLYQQCLKVNASAESPLYYLGDILYRQHRHAECQAYLSRLVASNCGEDYKTGALYLLAKSHISLDEHEEAEKQARSGLTLKPNHPHFLFILALVKNRMGDFDASITTLKKAFQHLGVDSDNLKVEIHDWLAQAYERKGEYTNASAELAMALKQDPSHVSSLITQGVIHMQLKKLEEAETSFRRALAIVKNHALALVRLGYCKLLCADSQEAERSWSKGTAWVPAALERSIAAIWAAGRRDRRSRDGHRSVRQSVRAVTTERKPTDPTTAVRWLGDAEIVGAQVAIKKLFCEDGGLEKEVAALRSALLETQRTVNVVEQGVGLNTPGNAWLESPSPCELHWGAAALEFDDSADYAAQRDSP
ncbi:UDP-N-acetylglucosamine--peptide N-acetylglucosaminyltransferase (O-GlcNAc) (OGT) [Durusdinium trenchii]|uniref:UDP-N-acetylglucosamine--peptide N-acetylglucosaminyltransferase (O-GlcNAc) (OGT) n=1 Tax=Durusdinium trenchii TaxID=1381693 RepID=A0ABP0L0W8_9DINO